MSRYHTNMSCSVVELVGLYGEADDGSAIYNLAHAMYRKPIKGDATCSIGFTAPQYAGGGHKIANGSSEMYLGPKSFAIWSDTNNWGLKFYKQIQELGIGTVTQFGPTPNNAKGGSTNVHLWVWHLDQPKLKTWYETEVARRSKEPTTLGKWG